MATAETASREHAAALDRDDALGFTREEFFIPTKAEAQANALPERGPYMVALAYPHALTHPPPPPPHSTPSLP